MRIFLVTVLQNSNLGMLQGCLVHFQAHMHAEREGDMTVRVAETEWHTHPASRWSTSWMCYTTWLTFYGTPSAASLYSPCWDTTIRTQHCNSDRVTMKWPTCGGTGCPRRQSRPSTKVRMCDSILNSTNGGPALVYASVTNVCSVNCLNNREFHWPTEQLLISPRVTNVNGDNASLGTRKIFT